METGPCATDDLAVTVESPGHDLRVGIAADHLDGEADFAGVEIGNDFQGVDPNLWNRFEPDGLPDAGVGGIHDSARLEHLLAARLAPRIGRVPDRDDQLLRSPRRECLGNVERERIIAAAMRAQLVPVEDDGRIPIDGPEVQQPALALLRRGKLEGPSVPDPLVGLDGLHHSGEGGFDRERDQDPTVKRRWTVAILGADGIIPQAIEIDPFRPDHLGSGILRVRFPGINLRRPACG